jgi:hypothetical protein
MKIGKLKVSVYRAYADTPDNWEKVSLAECIKYTEGSEYFKKGTVAQMLKDGDTVRTPWAFYQLQEV